MNTKLVDAHCHLHEYEDGEIENQISKLGILVIAVSDDYASSIRTLELSKKYDWVIPALGFHPWEITGDRLDEVEDIVNLIYENKDRVRILGEIGLDRRFRYETIVYQTEVFKRFLEVARELNLGATIHSVNTWHEVLLLLQRYDIPIAIFHWYTGPLELLKEIRDRGYAISINPAVIVQEKHRKVVKEAPPDILLIESDGPYNYRSLHLGPHLLWRTIEEIAKIRNLTIDEVVEVIYSNTYRIFKALRIPL